MRNFISVQAMELKQGEIRAFFDKAKKYENVISLGIGEPDFVTPRTVIDSAYRALLDGKTHYTANEGAPDTRMAVAKYLERYQLKYDPGNEIIITMGGMGALSSTLLTLIDPGDEVLIQDPQWLNYVSQVNFARGVAVRVPVYEEEKFSLKAENILKKLTDKSKILILNSPNNPTGAVIGKNDLRDIAELAIQKDLFVISDEVYSELIYDGEQHRSIASFPGMKERTIVINSLSKSFAMTGWRIGFAAGPSNIISKLTVLQENLVACAPAVAQSALVYAFTHLEEIEPMRSAYEARRDLFITRLNGIPGVRCLKPQGAFYAFTNIKDLKISSSEFAETLLDQYHVVVVPGSAFGPSGEGYIRMSYATSDDHLVEATERMKTFVKSLS
jgi:aminotransferase